MRGRVLLTMFSIVVIFWGVRFLVSSIKGRMATGSPAAVQPMVYSKTSNSIASQRIAMACKDAESCFKMHTKNPTLSLILRDRCSIGNISGLATRNLTFTHIAKCGGSSLRHLLNKHFKSRFQRIGPSTGPHIPFFLSQKKHPSNIFFTVLREPTSLAISLYNYINMRKTLPKHLSHDKFWRTTYNRDPIDWSNDKFIRKTLRNQVLRFFTWYSKSANYESGDFSNPHVWREYLSLPEVYNTVLDPWVPLSTQQQQSFTNYSSTIPTQYRCSSELNAALILIQRYSAVGVMEDYERFFHILHHRAKLNDEAFVSFIADSSEKRNPSTNKISPAKIKIVKNNLNDVLFCSRVLWQLASRISQHDAACYAIH